MELNSQYLVVLCVAFITFLFRYLPFAFSNKIKNIAQIDHLEKYLPACIMLILVIYTLKDTNFYKYPYGFTEIIAVFTVSVLHIQFRNALLSIIGGTLCYLILFNTVPV